MLPTNLFISKPSIVMKYLVYCAAIFMCLTACFEPRDPLPPNAARGEFKTALLELIQYHQRDKIRESCGEMAHQCFTNRDLAEFKASEKAEQIAATLSGNPRFVTIVHGIALQPGSFWQTLRQKSLSVCRPTWAQLGKIDCAGQTNAGQSAELEIAAAVVRKIEFLLVQHAESNLRPAANTNLLQKVRAIRWICYAPTNFNPDAGILPPDSSMEADLVLLKKAGFTGLVSYGCDGVLGKTLPALAQKHNFEGLILGIWSPENPEELQNARAAANLSVVTAFCVGNEGLNVRYDFETLKAVMDTLRRNTGKPVVSSEQVEDYADQDLLNLGDWVFPNVHPYWHKINTPTDAAAWTAKKAQDLAARSGRMVLLKEVGFPSAGDDARGMSEQTQADYYRLLENSGTPFCYFEAFDGPWKTWEPVEPYWGLFRADRSPKLVVLNLPGEQ